jgi:hypothetical protein
LEQCLDKLHQVWICAESYGLDQPKFIPVNLGWVYGARYLGRPGKDLCDFYLECLKAVKPASLYTEPAPDTQYVKKFVAATWKEIHRLEKHRKNPPVEPTLDEPPNEDRATLGLLGAAIPEDRLLRCEAMLEREFDRLLIQFERRQRLRTERKTIQLPPQTTMP